MSNDIGVYIAKFNDGYRVTMAANIQDIYYSKIGTDRWIHEIKRYFGKSELYLTEEEALFAAFNQLKYYDNTISIVHGIQWVGEFDYQF